VKNRTPLLQEQVFNVPYILPSGRVARLRGKWDSVDLITEGKRKSVWLMENKTKGDIDVNLMRRQLQFDLQTMLYLVALNESIATSLGPTKLFPQDNGPAVGVRYNVIRRPLAGGKGSIRQGKAETTAEFLQRLSEIIAGAITPEYGVSPGEHYFFMRWKVDITAADIERFKLECLNPVLENLCDDYEWWQYAYGHGWPVYGDHYRKLELAHHFPRMFRMPFGIYSPLLDGGATEIDEFLASSSTAGLRKAETLFEELQ
jgi:hypothetical protein